MEDELFETTDDDRRVYVLGALKRACEQATAKRTKAEEAVEKAALAELEAQKTLQNFIDLEGI
jgi:hypothetical protein